MTRRNARIDSGMLALVLVAVLGGRELVGVSPGHAAVAAQRQATAKHYCETPEQDDCEISPAAMAAAEKLAAEYEKGGNKCADVQTAQGIVRVNNQRGMPSVSIVGTTSSMSLPVSAGDAACLDVKYFPEQKILVYRVFEGTAGTSAPDEIYSLAVYYVGNQRLVRLLRREGIYILERDAQDGEFEHVLAYTLTPRGQEIVLELRDVLYARAPVQHRILKAP